MDERWPVALIAACIACTGTEPTPDAGARTAALGRTESVFTDGLQLISDVVVTPGSNFVALGSDGTIPRSRR